MFFNDLLGFLQDTFQKEKRLRRRRPKRRMRANRLGFIETLENRALLNADPVFSPDTYNFSIAEDAQVNAVVGTVSASDADGDILYYGISAGDPQNRFQIDTASGQIKLANYLDFESTASYTLTVSVSDLEATDTATVTITVTDVAEAPVFNPDSYSFSVAENSDTGSAVGTVTATDPQGDPLSYVISAGNVGGVFTINSSGQITVASSPIDFESTSSYTLTVEVSDTEFIDTATVTINVTDVNEAPSFSSSSYEFWISEDDPIGTTVGDVDATDPEGTTLSYSITGGDSNGHFSIDSNGTITVAAGLDYDTQNTYVLTIEVSDGVNSATVTVTINVTDPP